MTSKERTNDQSDTKVISRQTKIQTEGRGKGAREGKGKWKLNQKSRQAQSRGGEKL